MAENKGLAVHHLSEENFVHLVNAASVESGWNLCANDYTIWRKIFNEHSFFCVSKDGEPIGMCTATVLPNNVGYVGMFYVKEAYRGIGAGKTVFDAAMARLTDTENNCLAGAQAMHKKYATVFGFSIYQDWTIQQSAGIPNFNKINSSITGAELLSQHDHTIANQVCEYDKNVVGYNRSEFCEIWLAHPAGHSVVVIDSINRNVIGYGVIRRCMLKPRIGPVFADSSEICRAIIHKLIERMSEEISKLGVAILHKSDDIRVLRIAEEIGLKNVRESFMQYTKKKIPFDESRMFVFTDYEVQYV